MIIDFNQSNLSIVVHELVMADDLTLPAQIFCCHKKPHFSFETDSN